MNVMSRFTESRIAKRWLDQFPGNDKATATKMLDEILLVNASELNNSITNRFDQILEKRTDNRPLALYAERDINKRNGIVMPIFANAAQGRATGSGPSPIPSNNPRHKDVGSEGIIANLITSYCRKNRKLTLNHPGPDELRSKRAGPIIIATDFIGSGQRVLDMLEAFRAVASIRSWRSLKYIDFYVVAYSGTKRGIRRVEENGLQPKVCVERGCPTIYNAFREPMRTKVTNLCGTYPPKSNHTYGYQKTGALIAFEHGIPNNAPAMLHRKHKGWQPLFPQRSTISARNQFPRTNSQEIEDRANKLLAINKTENYLTDSRGKQWVMTMLVLAAIEAGKHTYAEISSYSRVDQNKVKEIIKCTETAKWTTKRNRLSRLGRSELKRLRKRRARNPVIVNSDKSYYYPTQLRAR